VKESRATFEFNNPRPAELRPVTEEDESESETIVGSADGATEKIRFYDANDLWKFDGYREKSDSEAASSNFIDTGGESEAENDEIWRPLTSANDEGEPVSEAIATKVEVDEQATLVVTQTNKEDTYDCLHVQRSMSNDLQHQVNETLEAAISALDAALAVTSEHSTSVDPRSPLPTFSSIGRPPRQSSWTSLRSKLKKVSVSIKPADRPQSGLGKKAFKAFKGLFTRKLNVLH
jgi:hypothetical protein